MIQFWEKLVTEGRADRQMDKGDFIERCWTNVKRPIKNK